EQGNSQSFTPGVGAISRVGSSRVEAMRGLIRGSGRGRRRRAGGCRVFFHGLTGGRLRRRRLFGGRRRGCRRRGRGRQRGLGRRGGGRSGRRNRARRCGGGSRG